MAGQTFPILLKYKGSMIIAEATLIDDSVDPVYEVRFNDKYTADFMYDSSTCNWVSENMELAEELSTYLQVSLLRTSENSVQPFGVDMEGKQYYIQQNTAGFPNVFFIYSTNEMLFRISFDQNDNWMADESYNLRHVEKFTKMIQDKRPQL